MVTNALIFHSRVFPKLISPPDSLAASHRFSAHTFHVISPGSVTEESSNVMVNHQPAKIGVHRYYGSGDMFLNCHVISLDHKIEKSYDFIDRSTSRYMTTLPILVTLSAVVQEIQWS